MTITHLQRRQYRVVSRGAVYYVDLDADGAADICSCAGYAWRGKCKHAMAVTDYEQDHR